MKTNLEIAQGAKIRPIIEIATSLGFNENDLELFGKNIAKIS